MTNLTITDANSTVDTARGPARAWGWALARGLLLGVGLGVAFRAWMRLVSTDPAFTWSGTIFILMICTIAGVGASLSRTARERWHRRGPRAALRTLGTVSVLLVGAGAGTLVLPIWLTGALAWGRRDWNRWIRIGLAAAAVLFAVGTVATISEDFDRLGLVRSVLSVPSLVAILTLIGVLFSWPTRWQPLPAPSLDWPPPDGGPPHDR